MGTSERSAQSRTAFACVRRVRENALSYDVVLPAARLFGAEPLLVHGEQGDGFPSPGFSVDGFPVAVSTSLIFDPLDAERGFGLVTLPRRIRLGFEGLPEVRHGMVRVTLIAPLPETVWRLDGPLVAAAV